LYTDSVFSVGIRSVFLGIYHTDTEGKAAKQAERSSKIRHIDETFRAAKYITKQTKDSSAQNNTDYNISEKFQEEGFPFVR